MVTWSQDLVARFSFVVMLALVLLAPWGMVWLHLDNSIEQWVVEDEGVLGFRSDFGTEDFLLLAYDGGDLFDTDALDVQLEVLNAVEALPAVTSVQSIPTVFRDHFGAESGEELEEEIVGSPFYEKAIVSSDHRMGGMLIGSNGRFSAQSRRDYVTAVRQAAEPLGSAGWKVYLVGPGALSPNISQSRDLLGCSGY